MARKKPRNAMRTRLMERLEGRTLLASPMVITKGGTYSGTWESLDPDVAAVTINTAEPVVIENSVIRSRGDLIESDTTHVNLTVRNTQGYGLNPNVYGDAAGEFIELDQFDNLVVENSYMEGTAGINVLNYAGDRTPNETVRIVGNKAKNIDGRKSNGAGGYLDFNERTRKSDGRTEEGYEIVQFVQLDKVVGVPGMEIAWNEVINEPGKSRVEDVINVYLSSGTASSPMLIHDNYIQGAYTVKPWMSDTEDATYEYDWHFSGGGILLGDGVGSTAAQDPAYVKAFDNTVVSTTNYGIAIAAGHDMEFFDNRIVSAGVLPDGRKIAEQNVGGYVWDSYKAGASRFYNNLAHHNLAGWVQADGDRNDYWTNDWSTMRNNLEWGGSVTLATEAAEHKLWQEKFAKRNGGGTISDPITPTPPPPTTPTPPPPTTPNLPPPPPPPPPPTDPVPPIDFQPPQEPPPPPPVDDPIEPIDFTGVVFDDRDGDGVKETGDAGIAGRTVYADLDGDKTRDGGEPATQTGADGRYTLSLEPGESYTIRQIVPAGWYQTSAKTTSGSTTTDFGVAKHGTISGSVFRDNNRNGKRQPQEAGLGGWVVFLDANNNGWRDASERAVTTDAQGKWKFNNLKAGEYRVRVQQKDRSLVRTTASYFRHQVFSGSSFTSDAFGYAKPLG